MSRSDFLLVAALILSGCSAPVQELTATRQAPSSLATAVRLPTSAAPDAGTPSMDDPNRVSQLRSLGNRASSSFGVLSPSTMHAVAVADHQVAETILSGAVINDHAPVYVVQMTGGSFSAQHPPPGVAAPQGNVLTLTIDATAMRVVDVGIVSSEVDLTGIGPVHDLLAD